MSVSENITARACNKSELHEMIGLVDSVMREGSDQTFLTDYPLVYQEKNLENIFVIKVNDEIASVVPFLPREIVVDDCQFTAGIISPTATSPNHRRKGYAGKCVNACCEKMIKDGISLGILWTSTDNYRFYGHSNFQLIRSQDCFYTCKKADANLFANNGHSIVEYNPQSQQYIKDIQSMHEKEIVGVLRASQDYPSLFSLPKSKTLIALKDDKAVGYLMVSDSINKPGLVEAGGEKEAVETLINYALSELDDETTLQAYANLSPTVMGDLFEERLPNRKDITTATGMMVRINNASDFLNNIKSWLEQKNAGAVRRFSISITDTSEVVSFNFSEQGLELGSDCMDTNLTISQQELASIVFGPHPEYPVDTPEVLKDLFPLYFPIWQLDHS